MRLLKTFLIICIVFGFATVATADLMTAVGVPVARTPINEFDVPPPVAGHLVNPWGVVTIFIPLSEAYSGIFGVTPVPGGATAGTTSDYITLPNSNAGGELTIFMRFSPVAVPAEEASLKFVFSDLDLEGVNDPPGFIETVQFFDQNGNPLSTAMDVSSDGEYVAADYAFTVETDYSDYSDTQVITFPDITGIATEPFYAEVLLATALSGLANGTWTNTAETIKATLTSSPASIPEPGTLILLGSGLVGIGLWRRKKFSRST